MIIEYHRPTTLTEALVLLARPDPVSLPLAGGTALDRSSELPIAVVDLQALGLEKLERRGNTLLIGAMTNLQTILESNVQPALRRAIEHEATYNLRHAASVAGTLVAAGGRSPFTTVLLALDAILSWLPGEEGSETPLTIGLGDLLPVRGRRLRGRLITQIAIPVNARLAYEYVARSPADQAIVCVAAARWPSGRVRVALGGFGNAPTLAFDGTESGGADVAACNAYSHAGDEWASAEYRAEIAGVLAGRCIQTVTS